MPKPLLLQLLRTYGSDVSGGQFEWSAELQFQSSGMVYLILVPTVDEEVNVKAPEPIAINTGFELFTELESSWYSYAGEIITEQDWQEVVATVTKIDQVLAQELEERVRPGASAAIRGRDMGPAGHLGTTLQRQDDGICLAPKRTPGTAGVGLREAVPGANRSSAKRRASDRTEWCQGI